MICVIGGMRLSTRRAGAVMGGAVRVGGDLTAWLRQSTGVTRMTGHPLWVDAAGAPT
ncbi:hypothetical protein D9M68_705450 [compost metagenome]